MYIKRSSKKKKFLVCHHKSSSISLSFSLSLHLLCTELAFPIKDWSILVQWRHELQKSSDKIIFKIKTVYDTKRKLHQWVLINTTLVSRVGWLDFSIVTTSRWSSHPLFFIEFGKIRSGFSEIFFFFYKSSDRNGNFRGWGHLLVSLVPDVDQLPESREAFFI